MKKEITTITIGILMLASAMAMYSGESITFETNLTSPVYTVSGNTSNLNGLLVEFTNGNITISSDPLMASDNFSMTFFDEVTKKVEKIIYTGGGGSSSGLSNTKYIDRNQTVYVPIYNTTVEEVEVEKIIDNETVLETGYGLWHLLLFGLICLVFGGAVTYYWGKSDDTKT